MIKDYKLRIFSIAQDFQKTIEIPVFSRDPLIFEKDFIAKVKDLTFKIDYAEQISSNLSIDSNIDLNILSDELSEDLFIKIFFFDKFLADSVELLNVNKLFMNLYALCEKMIIYKNADIVNLSAKNHLLYLCNKILLMYKKALGIN